MTAAYDGLINRQRTMAQTIDLIRMIRPPVLCTVGLFERSLYISLGIGTAHAELALRARRYSLPLLTFSTVIRFCRSGGMSNSLAAFLIRPSGRMDLSAKIGRTIVPWLTR
jgi:hypothetical protein